MWRWKELQPQDRVVYRDVGQVPPSPVTGGWNHAAFSKLEEREPWMKEVLAESDLLVDELLAADIIVAGVPPVALMAWWLVGRSHLKRKRRRRRKATEQIEAALSEKHARVEGQAESACVRSRLAPAPPRPLN